MKRLFALVALATAGIAAFGQALPAPEIAAREYLLIDMNAGQVLAERAADAPVDPASLATLMTAYVVFVQLKEHKLSLDQKLPVSARALAERKGGGALMYVDATATPTVDELLQGLVVDSGSDAAVALAEGVGGSVDNFVAMINRQAQAWNLKNTTFRNVTGLTEVGQRSTPRDLVTIAQHVIRDFPEYYRYYAQRDFTFGNIHQDNRNILLRRDPSVDGMKTAYTEAAGYCLLASAQRDFPNGKRRLVALVMGTGAKEARADEAQKLLNWGYTAFDDIRLVEAGKAVGAPVPVWKGRQAQVALGSADAIYVAVPKGEGDHLKTQIERTDPLVAPLTKGQRVGSLKVATAAGVPIATISLTVLEDVPQAGLFGRAWDAIRLWIK
ncbi:D-alanyl-D-alanine carboxypeptidase family protein [Scleromatobacter humisilvae]|uniref:serine-type D-Ala-D-Ala carboxypeptidase n=1 Tax=Scleromatobacter humisilvae TaxID=2897159 RepID=A0A9X1YL66_9BURK|nr:D-alanyl-D-alanine carboxypeptidase family protein [Scleromatobacter humisilvae]MCK9687762.1 D-alanyl-D-alanine carboxypeptidase [Scleromatobacter humisilvae]